MPKCGTCNDTKVIYNGMGETIPCEMCQFVDGLPRPVVVRFATDMEQRLQENDHRGGWNDLHTEWQDRLITAVGDLFMEYNSQDVNAHKVTTKAADVANIAMFLADIAQQKYLSQLK